MSFKQTLINLYRFVAHDIWRITADELSRTRRLFYNVLKTVVLTIKGFSNADLQLKASALTYYTLFAMVPVMALIFAIARGFGFQDAIVDTLTRQFAGQNDALPYVLGFVEKYLNRAQSGVFLGVGVAILLWSVMSGFRQIEASFNAIWQVKKSRSIISQFTTYFSMMLIVPVFLVMSSGISIFLSSELSVLFSSELFSPFVFVLVKISPYFINWVVFTALFIIFPNTKVRFVPALVAGVFTGTLFQLFQYLYIEGQVYLTSYNAVYGSFAIIPLLLLWIQFSWLIILCGAELSFAAQNLRNFEFEDDSKNISSRYRNFLTLLVMNLIIKRFENEQSPPDAEMLSKHNDIPIRLTADVLNRLSDAGMINEVIFDNANCRGFVPSTDINKITVSFLFEHLNGYGSEDFKVDKEKRFAPQWKILEEIAEQTRLTKGNMLVKDL